MPRGNAPGCKPANLRKNEVHLGPNRPEQFRCKAIAKRTGKRCGRANVSGQDFCLSHGGRRKNISQEESDLRHKRHVERNARARRALKAAPAWVRERGDFKAILGEIGSRHAGLLAESLMQGDQAGVERLHGFLRTVRADRERLYGETPNTELFE